MSGDPAGSGGAVEMAEAGHAGTVAVALLLMHVPADQVGIPVQLWPNARVMNHHQEVLGVDVASDCGYRVRAVEPGQVEMTRWRGGVELSRAVLPAGQDPGDQP